MLLANKYIMTLTKIPTKISHVAADNFKLFRKKTRDSRDNLIQYCKEHRVLEQIIMLNIFHHQLQKLAKREIKNMRGKKKLSYICFPTGHLNSNQFSSINPNLVHSEILIFVDCLVCNAG